jgi:predicted NUDIX family NTP pyrophosphohydrolase
MTSRVSAGILLFRRLDGRLEVLLAHPGGPLFAHKDEGAWTIPKGAPNGEADLLEAALREFAEETGHEIVDLATDPGEAPLPLGTVVQASGKVVHGWAVEGDLDPSLARSNLFDIEWPPRSGTVRRVPEVDRVAWFEPIEARVRANRAQGAFVDRLEELLTGERPPSADSTGTASHPSR